MPQPPREKLVKLIIGMIEKQGPAMAAELERRVETGAGLEIKGIKFDVSMIEEALEKVDGDEAPRASARPATSSAQRAAPGPKAESQRWMPGAPSASLLAARALQECEQAEVFSRKAEVPKGSGGVPVLEKPDILGSTTGQSLADGATPEVVARFCSPRDGRVYLRLKAQSGWASTRSRDDLSKVVLQALPQEPPLEPVRTELDARSSVALRLLQELDPETETPLSPRQRMPAAPAAHRGASASSPARAAPAGPADAADGDQEAEDFDEGEEEEEDDLEEPEEELDGEERVDGDQAPAATSREAAGDEPPTRGPKREQRFRVVVSRVPVLSAPGAEHLMAANFVKAYNMKEEFVADGAVYFPGEGRVYLRVKGGHGWVSERAQKDVRRMGVMPITRRKTPLSKKMAKAVAFRGGDTDGATKLKREDLVKNSAGKIVSKRASETAKKRYADSSICKWTEAVKRAKTEMGLTGFVAVKKGTEVYEKAQQYFNEAKGGPPPGTPSAGARKPLG